MTLLQLRKRTMTLAGSVMTAYLIFHMLTNLSFFSAPAFEQFYAFYNQVWIRWPLLALVLIALFIHVKAAMAIRIKNSQARQVGYKKHDKLHIPAPLVSLSIVLLLIFILVHIGQTLMLDTSQVRQAMLDWFSSGWMLLFYLAGLLILAMHLLHSLVNVLQTLGISSSMHRLSISSGVVLLTIGFAAVPLYIWITA
ncbi:succinate dehydrogenase [Methylophaga sp.]|jgi:succinate dehydrogenase / fumarate reductase cytochrome b subunit|uniref:succinate dehydrogenase n=1 Tax=Methylophaga sp. TaxID=2024840 RepID=UPI0013FF3DC0|nr:succinate dehydrogenase [Methylophaga sp.]MTI64075.1 succinate dehydrogenase [Methylophaga sp.]